MWYAISQASDTEAEISIYDEIGSFGVGAKQFLGEVQKLAGKHIHLRINSPGGSVVEGTAIFNALRRHKGGVTVHIDALAASMASVIAMSGSPVLMADNALLMLHNPWTISMGDSDDLRKEADLLDMLKANIRNAYVRKSGMDEDTVQEMMDNETWLGALDAVALGLVDAIEEGVPAAAMATPTELRARFDKLRSSMEKPVKAEAEVPPVIEPETVIEDAPVDGPVLDVPAVAPVEPVVEGPAAEASASAVALAERIQALVSENSILKNEAKSLRTDLERAEAALGVLPSRTVAPAGEASDTGTGILDRFNSIADPAEQNAFYRKHEAELKAALKQSSIK
jgi:ATP-dependent protease ClpP protease subunit